MYTFSVHPGWSEEAERAIVSYDDFGFQGGVSSSFDPLVKAKACPLRGHQWTTHRRQPPWKPKPPLRAAGAAAAPRLGTQNPGSAGGYVVSLVRPLR